MFTTHLFVQSGRFKTLMLLRDVMQLICEIAATGLFIFPVEPLFEWTYDPICAFLLLLGQTFAFSTAAIFSPTSCAL